MSPAPTDGPGNSQSRQASWPEWLGYVLQNIMKSVFWSVARQKGVGRERRKYRAAPVAKKRVELSRWHGFPLWAVNEGGTVPGQSRAVGEWLEGR